MESPEPSRFQIGDIVYIHQLDTDGYVTDSEFDDNIGAYMYYVETPVYDDWFRASDLQKIGRTTREIG